MFVTSKGGSIPSLPTMQTYCGKCPHHIKNSSAPVMGRVVFSDISPKGYYNEALLTVVKDGRIPDIGANTVGVICVSDSPKSESQKDTLPCPTITLNELPRNCEGKIALLDPSAEKLFVSPDISTVDEYVKRTAEPPPFKMPHKGLTVLPTYSKARDILTDTKGFLLESDAVGSAHNEETLYELYRDIAEISTGAAMTVALELDVNFQKKLRALYRSAVYGRISLLLRGILTAGDIKKALSEAHSVFCELEAEGREFNGYISRGICIDSPYLLSKPISGDGIDFCIFDAERLLRLMTNRVSAPNDEVMKDIARSIVDYKASLPQIRSSVILESETAKGVFLSELISGGITRLYAPWEKLDDVLKGIRGIKSEE